MTRRLPPLNAVRAFEAAARHGSFLDAGAELGVTAGAVSQQIKLLEGALGARLFERLHRGVQLTEAGAAYLPEVRDALDLLAAATARLDGRKASRVLRITALPAFAEKWLVPRLARFRRRHPQIDVRLSADAEMIDFAAREFDLGLRYSDGDHPGLRVDRLVGETLFPVCSPALLKGDRPLRKPADLARQVLLYDVHWQEDWTIWLRAAGLAELGLAHGMRFTLYSMAIDAAIEGLGVAVGHSALVADDLAAGRLVAPFALRVAAPRAHYFVAPRWSGDRTAVRAFRAWLMEEAAQPPRQPPRVASTARSRGARRP